MVIIHITSSTTLPYVEYSLGFLKCKLVKNIIYSGHVETINFS